jgi:hypothetical protein
LPGFVGSFLTYGTEFILLPRALWKDLKNMQINKPLFMKRYLRDWAALALVLAGSLSFGRFICFANEDEPVRGQAETSDFYQPLATNGTRVMSTQFIPSTLMHRTGQSVNNGNAPIIQEQPMPGQKQLFPPAKIPDLPYHPAPTDKNLPLEKHQVTLPSQPSAPEIPRPESKEKILPPPEHLVISLQSSTPDPSTNPSPSNKH